MIYYVFLSSKGVNQIVYTRLFYLFSFFATKMIYFVAVIFSVFETLILLHKTRVKTNVKQSEIPTHRYKKDAYFTTYSYYIRIKNRKKHKYYIYITD